MPFLFRQTVHFFQHQHRSCNYGSYVGSGDVMSTADVSLHYSQGTTEVFDIVVLIVVAVTIAIVMVIEVIGGAFAFPSLLGHRTQCCCKQPANASE